MADVCDAFYAKDQLPDEEAPKASRAKKRRRKANEGDRDKQSAQEDKKAGPREAHADEDSERAGLLCEARYLSSGLEEWASLATLDSAALRAFCTKKSYENHQKTAGCVVQAIHHVFSETLDKLVKGEGYVSQELRNDISLAEAIHQEGVQFFFHLLNNKLRIGVLTLVDVINGKKRQRALAGAVERSAVDNDHMREEKFGEEHSASQPTAGS